MSVLWMFVAFVIFSFLPLNNPGPNAQHVAFCGVGGYEVNLLCNLIDKISIRWYLSIKFVIINPVTHLEWWQCVWAWRLWLTVIWNSFSKASEGYKIGSIMLEEVADSSFTWWKAIARTERLTCGRRHHHGRWQSGTQPEWASNSTTVAECQKCQLLSRAECNRQKSLAHRAWVLMGVGQFVCLLLQGLIT